MAADDSGNKIAFADEFEGRLQVVDVPSGKISNLNVGSIDVHGLAFSKSKQAMALVASEGHDEPESIYLFWLSNNKSERIFDAHTSGFDLYRPEFDPSGQYVYALNYSKGIFRYSLSEKKRWEKVNVTGNSGINFQGLSFSHSGTKVALSHDLFNGFLIASVTADGFHIDQEILGDFKSCISPRWIGDNAIVFAGRKKAGSQYLWEFNLNTNTLTQLTSDPIASRDFLSLSNDEKAIVFTATSKEQPLEWRLWLLKLDGSKPVQITKGGNSPSDLFPVWLN